MVRESSGPLDCARYWPGSAADLSKAESWDSGGDIVPRLFMTLIVLYMLAALVQRIIPFSVNRVLGAAIMVVLGFDFLRRLTQMRAIAFFILCLLIVANVGILTTDALTEIEFFIYFGSSLLVLCYLSSHDSASEISKALSSCKYFAVFSVCFAAAIVLFLLISGLGYQPSSWGGEVYFTGWCNAEHTMASVACLVMTFSLVLNKLGHFPIPPLFLVLGIMSYALFQTGARTFLIPDVIILINAIRISMKRVWCQVASFLLIMGVAVAIFASTGMAAKFMYIEDGAWATGESALSIFTSGRDQYWLTDLSAFFSGNPITWIVGASSSFVYNLNAQVFDMRIWAHNDFVMLLCSVGVLGIAIYLSALRAFFRQTRKCCRPLPFLLLVVYVMFPAIINGFYSYQHFVYSAVFLFVAIVIDSNTCQTPHGALDKMSVLCRR